MTTDIHRGGPGNPTTRNTPLNHFEASGANQGRPNGPQHSSLASTSSISFQSGTHFTTVGNGITKHNEQNKLRNNVASSKQPLLIDDDDDDDDDQKEGMGRIVPGDRPSPDPMDCISNAANDIDEIFLKTSRQPLIDRRSPTFRLPSGDGEHTKLVRKSLANTTQREGSSDEVESIQSASGFDDNTRPKKRPRLSSNQDTPSAHRIPKGRVMQNVKHFEGLDAPTQSPRAIKKSSPSLVIIQGSTLQRRSIKNNMQPKSRQVIDYSINTNSLIHLFESL